MIELNLPKMESMNQEQLMEECNRWRKTAPKVIERLAVLSKFQKYADSVEELERKIQIMKDNYQGAIELKDRQIQEMDEMIQYMKNDPLGLDRKFKKPVKSRPH